MKRITIKEPASHSHGDNSHLSQQQVDQLDPMYFHNTHPLAESRFGRRYLTLFPVFEADFAAPNSKAASKVKI